MVMTASYVFLSIHKIRTRQDDCQSFPFTHQQRYQTSNITYSSTLTTANPDNNPPQCWWMVWVPMPPSESPAEQAAENADMKRQMKLREDLER